MSRVVMLAAILIGLILLGAGAIAPTPALAAGVDCSADASSIVVGGTIHIQCVGFDPNVYVNSYVVDGTGFAEVGRANYAACVVGGRTDIPASAKTDETGTASYTWYTQNGVSTCPISDYTGYANQLGTYTVVIQQLDGKGGVKYVGTVVATLTGNGKTYSGAELETDGPAVSGGTLTVYGFGFAPNEFVNIWFTRPGDCSGLAVPYWTGVSAFSPTRWSIGGVAGADSVKTDSLGAFTAGYLMRDFQGGVYPCLGTWHVTAKGAGSGLGAESAFVINGKSVNETAQVWTTEDRVPSNNQPYPEGNSGVAVHAYGSGFPAGAVVNCWFTRPDGTVIQAFDVNAKGPFAVKADAAGTFAGIPISYTSELRYQGDQPGTWALTCGTADGKYTGIAHFLVYPLPLIDP